MAPNQHSPTLSRLLHELQQDAPGVIEEVSPREHMHRLHLGGEVEGYLETGQWALKRIRLAMLAASKETVLNILDLPCGYGRVMRALGAEFPQATLTACDIDPKAVDFCAETFGALPVYSAERPEEIEIEDRFDLIWCGSLLTHLDHPGWTAFLRLFESLLEPGGVLVFTTNGRFIADRLLRPRAETWGMTEEQITAILQSHDDDGFGYGAYEWLSPQSPPPEYEEQLRALSLPANYGISLASPSWVCGLLETEAPKLDLLTYTAGGNGPRWGRSVPANGLNYQDMVSCIRLGDDQVQ